MSSLFPYVYFLAGHFAIGLLLCGLSYRFVKPIREIADSAPLRWMVACAWLWPILVAATLWDIVMHLAGRRQ